MRFVLEGPDETSTFSLIRRSSRVDLSHDDASRPDCQVRCSVADFHALIAGSLDPRQGYLSGRLQVVGDVGIVLEMRRAVLKKNHAS